MTKITRPKQRMRIPAAPKRIESPAPLPNPNPNRYNII
jgi:hypothetical protein